MVPVDEVEKQTLMLEPPCRIRISAFRRRKKASAEPHACPVAAWVPVQSPADPTAQTCRGARVADESKAVGASVGCRRLCSFRMPGVPARLEIVPGVCWLFDYFQ